MEKTEKHDPMELVSIRIPRNPMTKATGVYVNVNTHNHFVPYGKPVEVPRYAAEVIQRSIDMDDATAEKINILSGETEQRFNDLDRGIV